MLILYPQTTHGSQVKTPAWFRRTLAVLLRDVIMISPNTQILLCSFLGGDNPNSSCEMQEWKKCAAAAQIISHCPVSAQNIATFYSSVSNQLIEVLNQDVKANPLVMRAAGLTLTELYKLQPQLVSQSFTRLFQPLLRCCQLGGLYMII